MHENEKYAMAQQLGQARGMCDVQAFTEPVTVGDNIDRKIAIMKAEIERLEASKATLGPLLAMKIRDIREAMQF